MEETFSTLFILNVLTVVHGVCDRNAISDCILALQPLSSSGTLPDAHLFCKLVSTVNTCIALHKAAGEGDDIMFGVRSLKTTVFSLCGENKAEDGYIKFGKECFESERYLNAARNCQNQYVEENPISEAETQPQVNTVCQKTHGMFDCVGNVIQRLCSQDAFEFFNGTKIKYIAIISRTVNCPLLGTTQTPTVHHDGRSANIKSSQFNAGSTHAVMTVIWTGCLLFFYGLQSKLT
ncbi:unnamed protein product [Mytilus coruscus]|uniref:Uncharacterized protein n=1 Tax=Mytilus coruscus TaxID=42192 RepID=A0A6J8DLT0_MYTCO|nr:unnamed protein product [Mytilus coruscus]